ncbi:hypothetical protein D3C73_850920 [compost metagenome]
MFLIHNDKSQITKWSKNGRSGSDCDLNLAFPNFTPFVISFPMRQATVHDRNLAPETAFKSFHHLRGKRNFGNQHYRLTSRGNTAFNRL